MTKAQRLAHEMRQAMQQAGLREEDVAYVTKASRASVFNWTSPRHPRRPIRAHFEKFYEVVGAEPPWDLYRESA